MAAVALAALLLKAGIGRAENAKELDWDALTREATELLSNYIKINTSNPPGNELAAAKMLKEKFLHDGIPAAVFEPAPGRGVIAARLRGVGKNHKALILLSHMDVVPANAKEWSVPPFSGLVKSGEVWGRGALDDKGPGVVALMAMLAIKRARDSARPRHPVHRHRRRGDGRQGSERGGSPSIRPTFIRMRATC